MKELSWCHQMISFFSSLSWGTIWTSVGSVTTLVTAGVTYCTVREMKKGREQSMMPHLVILRPNERYQFRWIPLDLLQPIIRPQFPDNKSDQYGTRIPVFRLKNIGNGPAKNIQINWKIRDKDTINAITRSEILKKYNVRVNDGSVSLEQQNKGLINGCTISFSDEMTSTIDYCISSPATDFIEPLKIPYDIEASYELRLMAINRPTVFGPLKLPNMDIHIKYQDNEGKQYQRHFIVEPCFTYLPDAMSSSDNPISKDHFSSDNIRGDIVFFVRESS